MWIVKNRIIFFIFSALLAGFSIFAVLYYGFNFGIDFTGGSIVEVSYPNAKPTTDEIRLSVAQVIPGEALIQEAGDKNYIIRTKELDAASRDKLITALSAGNKYQVTEERYDLVGPSIGTELRRKAWIAITVVLLSIIFFIAFAFRKVTDTLLDDKTSGVSSWLYGATALVVLAHDVIIPTGIFAFLGSIFIDAQINVLFITALLAVLGYSVSDTIVVFDRVRENLRLNKEKKLKRGFEETVGVSLSQTLVRSFNTSFAALLVLGALYFIGGSATKNFALVMAIGVAAGTYSSIFIAAPLLVVIEKWNTKRKQA